jgi:hypothetical protein
LKKKREKLMIFIGRSVDLVSLETVLHIYQIADPREDIGINLDGINWSKLLKNSKEKMTIPNSNDKNRNYSENISEVNIEMG